jgi:hypothetical protein
MDSARLGLHRRKGRRTTFLTQRGLMLSRVSDLDRFFEALHDKTWIEILTATQDEICKLSRHPRLNKLDPLAAYLASLKEFEAYLLNPTDPLPEEYQTLVRKMQVPQDRDKAKAGSAKIKQKIGPK